MLLYDLINNGYGNEEDYNCAEKILYGSNKAYNLGLSNESLKLSAGFGGGMGIENTCGVITAGIMVLSHLFVKEIAHESTIIKEKTAEFINNFVNDMKSINCDILKEMHRTEERKCKDIILKSADLLDKIFTAEKRVNI